MNSSSMSKLHCAGKGEPSGSSACSSSSMPLGCACSSFRPALGTPAKPFHALRLRFSCPALVAMYTPCSWRSLKLKRNISVCPATMLSTKGRYLRGSPTMESRKHSSYVELVQPKMTPAAAAGPAPPSPSSARPSPGMSAAAAPLCSPPPRASLAVVSGAVRLSASAVVAGTEANSAGLAAGPECSCSCGCGCGGCGGCGSCGACRSCVAGGCKSGCGCCSCGGGDGGCCCCGGSTCSTCSTCCSSWVSCCDCVPGWLCCAACSACSRVACAASCGLCTASSPGPSCPSEGSAAFMCWLYNTTPAPLGWLS
mmetsp:Transcript_20166/g.47687  ORF Transcript_20166/g.47687 Transcript_20166/m.47687 type:complete len:311 (-) Transcript_20166:120-1052(-)